MPTTFEQLLSFPQLEQEALFDPVSKFRISAPQSLMDTDFEYSLQPTKWETLELVNNIPMCYYRFGDPGIQVLDVTAIAGNYFVTVTTRQPHNLVLSSAFVIQGLASTSAEGSFIVHNVLSTTSFIYFARSRQTITGSIYDPYTTALYAAWFYQGAQLKPFMLQSITTNEANPSQITVTTNAPHGFLPNTYMMLTNMNGRKVVSFDASVVGTCNVITDGNSIYAPGHDLYDTMMVTYSNVGNASISGLANQATYYVKNMSLDRFKLASSLAPSLDSNEVNILAQGSGIHQIIAESSTRPVDGSFLITSVPSSNSFVLEPANQITYVTRNFVSSNIYGTSNLYLPNHGFRTGTPVQYSFLTGSNALGSLVTASNYFISRIDSNTFMLANTSLNAFSNIGQFLGSVADASNMTMHSLKALSLIGDSYGSGFLTLTSNSTTIVGTGVNFATTFKLNDAIDIEIPAVMASLVPLSVNTALLSSVSFTTAHNIVDGDMVYYAATTTVSNPINGLSYGRFYYVRSASPIALSFYYTREDALLNSGSIILGTTTINANNGVIQTFSARIGVASINTSTNQITTPQTHNLVNGDGVIYRTTGLPISSNLLTQSIYFVRAPTTTTLSFYNTYNDAITSTNIIRLTTSVADNLSVLDQFKPSTMFSTTITSFVSSNVIQVRNAPLISISGARYYVQSAVYPKMDGIVNHRPVDGSIELIPSPSPLSQIIRQTRRYFRYQSGKGMQVSFAVNFSPSTSIEQLFTESINGQLYGVAYTKRAHRLAGGVSVTIQGASGNDWNGGYVVSDTPNTTTFRFSLGNKTPVDAIAQGNPGFYVEQWTNSSQRTGMYDDQNGMFFEYDGSTLYAVRRNSVQQLPGYCTTAQNSSLIQGTNTAFTSQLAANDMIVVKGQSYKVTSVVTDTVIYIQPPYRGISTANVIISKTNDTRVPRTQWSIDRCDGTGPSGYNLDIHKIQMCFIDYSWYGAGKVRFGVKDDNGMLCYVHEFIHNNQLNEAYLRSGNLPCRFEVHNVGIPLYVPSLSHWGISVIMDGRFDDDKAYLFTANGNLLAFTNDTPYTFTGSIQATDRPLSRMSAQTYSVVQYIRIGSVILSPNNVFQTNTRVTRIERFGTAAYLYLDKAPIATSATNTTYSVGSLTTDVIPELIPLVSVRLAPSVDNGRVGALGSRDVINRMQLNLKSIDVITSNDVEVKLILNGNLTNRTWQRMTLPSLSQIITHGKGESIDGGINIYTFRAAGGFPDSTNRRITTLTTQALTDMLPLGNAIMGGDGVFPEGPDIVTVCASCYDFNGITNINPFTVGARLSWTESQA